MVDMPEIQQLLDDHLDIEKGASPSVRAVYGMRLGHLFFLDESWTGLVNELDEHGLGDYRDALSPNEPPAGGSQLP